MQRASALGEQTRPQAVPAGRRAVIVAGTRTPFTRAFSEQMNATTIDLGVCAVTGLLEKTKVDPKHINHVVWGGVILPCGAVNVAREIIIDMKGTVPYTAAAHTVSMACASGLKAVLDAVHEVESGNADVVVAGGSDSTSNAELPMTRPVVQSLALYSQGKIGAMKLLSVAGLPCGWMPPQPQIAERSTGKTMGYHADVMAQLHSVSRADQDKLAMQSHINAAAAAKAGLFKDEIVPLKTKGTALRPAGTSTKDTMVRAKQDPKKMASLKTVFRKEKDNGTITAANASPLTDGAAACLIMSADKAKALGYAADVAVRSYAMSGINPQPNLLLAPALAIPVALRRAGLSLADIDYFEIHEAFAGQVLATVHALREPELARKYLGLEAPLGAIPLDRVNVYGGSVSIGHPFGATGARVTTNCARILREKKEAKYVLASVCAAGGLGLVTIFEKL